MQDNGGTANGGVDLDPTPNTMTINVTAVNDAPAGTNTTVTTLEDTRLHLHTADFGFTDPNDAPANALLGGEDHHAARRRHADTTTASPVTPASSSRSPTSTPASSSSRRRPTPTAARYTSFTFQVQDNGGTANGGVDLDPTPNTLTINVTPVNDAPAGTEQHGDHH